MKMLIPLDGSALALEAVRWVIRLANDGLRVSAVLANVQSPSTLYEVMVVHDADVLERVSEAAGTHALEAGLALLREAGIDCECEVAAGDAAHELVAIAERHRCDGIAMAARGAGALSAALLGSVSHGVLRACSVPVTIVREAAPAAADEPLPEEI